MKTREQELNVKALCSRKLLDLLKSGAGDCAAQRGAIEAELLQRRHYLDQLAQLSDKKRLLAPSTATRH